METERRSQDHSKSLPLNWRENWGKLNSHEFPEFDERIRKIAVIRNGSSSNPFSHTRIYIEAETCAFVVEKGGGPCANKIIRYSTPGDEMVMSWPSFHFDTPLAEGKGTVAQLIQYLLDKGKTSKTYDLLTNNCHHTTKKAFDNFNSDGLKYKKFTFFRCSTGQKKEKTATFRKIHSKVSVKEKDPKLPINT